MDNVLAGLEAAFVDIGLEKNGFLHVDEIVLPGVEAPRRGRGSGRDGRQITDMLKPGQDVVVQVVKDPLKSKGARLSMDLRSPAATWSTPPTARASECRAGWMTRSESGCEGSGEAGG